MAQATGVQSFSDAYVEFKPANLGIWVDASGWGSSVAVDGGDRQTGWAYTFDGDVAVGGVGKREPRTVTIRTIYTEGAADPWKYAWDAYRNNQIMQVRWSPKGGDANEKRYTTDATYSFVKNCPPPGGEAGSGDPMAVEIVVETADITQDTEVT